MGVLRHQVEPLREEREEDLAFEEMPDIADAEIIDDDVNPELVVQN
jgi:hypothetical protein